MDLTQRPGTSEPEVILDLAGRLAPAHCALLIIDMQKDFCDPGFGAAQAGRDLSAARTATPVISQLLQTARRCRVAVAHVGFSTLPAHGSDSGPWLAQRRRATFSSDKLCIDGEPGAAFIDALAPQENEWVVHKRRYSAFTGTDLDLLLRSRAIRTLVITGVSTNACVESTLRAAFELDYYICVPPDGVGSWDRTLHDATLANVNHRFGLTPPASEICEIWNKAADDRRARF